MVDPEAIGEKYQKYVKWGVIAVGLALTAPLAYMALEGLVFWGAFLAIAFLLFNFAPVFAAWVANKKIQAIVAVAEANPIETMQALFIEKSQELETADNNVRDFDMEIRNFSDMVVSLKKDYPEEAESYEELAAKMVDAKRGMVDQQAFARAELEKFSAQIKKAEALFKMAKQANKMIEKSKSAEAAAFSEIKKKVAFDKVRSDLNRAFANLDMAMERRKNIGTPDLKPVTALPPAIEAEVIDITSSARRQPVPFAARKG